MEQWQMANLLTNSVVRLSTALNEIAGKKVTPYKSVNLDEPRTVWVLESYTNWKELFAFTTVMRDEYEHAFKEEHPARNILHRLESIGQKYAADFPQQEATEYVPPVVEEPEEEETEDEK
jgi:hypothetical protein